MTDKIFHSTEDEAKIAELTELRARLDAVAHAMQSGVAFEMRYSEKPTDPKHLRVGVNASMVEIGALVNLLVEKGVFTYEEFYNRSIAFMELEVKTYEKRLSEFMGRDVTLK